MIHIPIHRNGRRTTCWEKDVADLSLNHSGIIGVLAQDVAFRILAASNTINRNQEYPLRKIVQFRNTSLREARVEAFLVGKRVQAY